MKFLGMLGVPIVGEVGPDGKVEFDDRIADVIFKRARFKRWCPRCKRYFLIFSKDDPMLICERCINGR